jgi:hypothetical protein
MKQINLIFVIFVGLSALPSPCQSKMEFKPESGLECPADADALSGSLQRIHREQVVEDFGTHQCWLLKRNLNRPAVPASWILLPDGHFCALLNRRARGEALGKNSPKLPIPLIRAGENLTLSEHTPVSDMRIEAVALGQGRVGEIIMVRTKIVGRPLRARVTAPGEVRLLADTWEAEQ